MIKINLSCKSTNKITGPGVLSKDFEIAMADVVNQDSLQSFISDKFISWHNTIASEVCVKESRFTPDYTITEGTLTIGKRYVFKFTLILDVDDYNGAGLSMGSQEHLTILSGLISKRMVIDED